MAVPLDSIILPIPLLHLPLDRFDLEIGDDGSENYFVRTADVGVQNRFEIQGTPILVPDDHFGSAVLLDGDSTWVDLGPLSQLIKQSPEGTDHFSVSLWIKAADKQQKNRSLLSTDGGWQLDLGPSRRPRFSIPAGTDTVMASARTFLGDQQWMHVVGIYNGSTAQLFVDSVLVSETALESSAGRPQANGPDANSRLRLGSQGQGGTWFNGLVAGLRLYGEPLSAEQVSAIGEADQSLQAAFQQQYPFDFELADDDVRNTLYISDSGLFNEVSLRVTNTARTALQLTRMKFANGALPDADHHHLELRLRQGTLKSMVVDRNTDKDATLKPALIVSGQPAGWTSSVEPQLSADGLSTSLYFAWSGTRGATDTFDSGASAVFDLEYGTADGQAGSRGTNVVLGYRGFHWDAEDQQRIDVTGERIHSVDVVNQSGKRDVPLLVGFVGTNRVLNTGTSWLKPSESDGDLTLRLLNTLTAIEGQPERNRLRFRSLHAREGADADAATKFTISFDTDPKNSWALTALDNAKGVEVTWQPVRSGRRGAAQRVLKDLQANSVVWSFSPTIDDLGPGDYIDLVFKGIVTTHESGLSNLYINYEDLPGYWDGQFVAIIEKSPIVYRNKKVGIGSYPSENNQLQVYGGVNVVSGDLTVDQGNLVVNSAGIKMNWGTKDDWAIHNANGALMFSYNNFDSVLFGESDGQVRIRGSGGLQVENGPLSVSRDLTVGGVIKGAGNLDVSGHSTLTGNLTVGGVIKGAGNLDVSGHSTLTGNLTVGGVIKGNGGKLTLKDDVEVNGELSSSIHFHLKYRNENWWSMSVGGSGLTFQYRGESKAYITPDGKFQTWSDSELKCDIKDLKGSLSRIRALRPRAYRWKDTGNEDIGFIAQEVAAVAPDRVSESGGKLSLTYRDFTIMAIGAIQEQQDQIDALQHKLEKLEPS